MKDLTPDPSNANKGTQRGRAMVETSVRRFGFGRSVLADKNGVLIAGNKTVEAASAMGDPHVIVVQTTGKDLVVVQRTDLDVTKDADAHELGIVDNRSSEVGLQWEPATLRRLEESGADPKQFWRAPEWDKLVGDVVEAAGEDVPDMALQPFEEYNYLVVVFKNSPDWEGACDKLSIRREGVTLGTTRKIGLGRVLDGATLMEHLCKSSSPAASASTPSGNTRSRSSPRPSSVSPPVKPRRTRKPAATSSSTPTT